MGKQLLRCFSSVEKSPFSPRQKCRGFFLFGPVNRLTRGYSKFFKNLWGGRDFTEGVCLLDWA
jgi:hypothetical protein